MCKDRLVDYHDTIKYFGSEFCYVLSYIMFSSFFTSFDAPVPILMQLDASFGSPETFFLVICNIFINMVKCHYNIDYRYPLNYVSL